MAQGAYIAIVYPFTALLRLPLFAWRSYRRGQTKMFPQCAISGKATSTGNDISITMDL